MRTARTGPRLAQSYYDESGLTDTGFIYDNALTIIALLAGGDVTRARAIGDALLYAQSHDEKYTDGRLRQAYHANDFITEGKAHFGWEYGLVGTAVGDMSWSGIALAQLARRTRQSSYQAGALRIAHVDRERDPDDDRARRLRLRGDRRAGGLQVGRAQHRRLRALPHDRGVDR